MTTEEFLIKWVDLQLRAIGPSTFEATVYAPTTAHRLVACTTTGRTVEQALAALHAHLKRRASLCDCGGKEFHSSACPAVVDLEGWRSKSGGMVFGSDID